MGLRLIYGKPIDACLVHCRLGTDEPTAVREEERRMHKSVFTFFRGDLLMFSNGQ